MTEPIKEIALRGVGADGLEGFGRYYSFYPGYCRDDADPDGLGRIRVEVPVISACVLPHWAPPKAAVLGPSEHGVSAVPRKGSPVIVEFLFGDINRPYYSAGTPTRRHAPSSAAQSAEVRSFDTDSARVSVDDANERVTVEFKGTNTKLELENDALFRVTLGPQSHVLRLEADGSFALENGATGFRVEMTAAGFGLVVAQLLHLGAQVLLPTAGVVTGETVCPFTGVGHVDVSPFVRARKV
jgi:hypothetical protein